MFLIVNNTSNPARLPTGSNDKITSNPARQQCNFNPFGTNMQETNHSDPNRSCNILCGAPSLRKMDLFGIRILLQSVFLVTIVFLFLSYGGLNGHCPRVRAHRHQFGLRYDLGTPMIRVVLKSTTVSIVLSLGSNRKTESIGSTIRQGQKHTLLPKMEYVHNNFRNDVHISHSQPWCTP